MEKKSQIAKYWYHTFNILFYNAFKKEMSN